MRGDRDVVLSRIVSRSERRDRGNFGKLVRKQGGTVVLTSNVLAVCDSRSRHSKPGVGVLPWHPRRELTRRRTLESQQRGPYRGEKREPWETGSGTTILGDARLAGGEEVARRLSVGPPLYVLVCEVRTEGEE